MGSDDRGPDTNGSPRASEERLLEIRRQAEALPPGQALLPPVAAGSRMNYYGLPVLKQPQWTWEVPVYFFVGGTAGAAALIASAGAIGGAHPILVRDARRLAALCGAVSPLLLVADLGKPSRFLNMFRVFKLQSPMSVGSWTLLFFSSAAAFSAFADHSPRPGPGGGPGNGPRHAQPNGKLLPMLGTAAQTLAAVTGGLLSTYTGVLVGATAVPVWAENSVLLPFHFGASGLASAVSVLQLAGHDNNRALQALGIATAATETAIGARIELESKPALQPLKTGTSGWITRAGGLLSGPVPLVLRLLAGRSNSPRATKLRRLAAASSIAGSVLTRFAWVKAGQASARDPNAVLSKPVDPPRMELALGDGDSAAPVL